MLRKQKSLETIQLDFNRKFNKNENEQILVHETLKRMSCKGCGFTKIQKRHFTAVTEIVSLDLSENQINSIDTDAFELNSNLRLLDLSENKLKILHYLTFSKLRHFEDLILSQNLIEFPKFKPFLKCDSLKKLKLNTCKLVDMYRETFSELRSIEQLDLNANLIESLPLNVFKMNLKLKSLFIESNRLKFFPVSILDSFSQISELCVDKNTFENCQEFSAFVKKYNGKILRTSNCNLDEQYFVENLFKDPPTIFSEGTTEKSLKVNAQGISNFFLGSYLSIILLVQAVFLVLLTLYFIKVIKYDELENGGDVDINYANTILNDNDIYKVYKLDE